MIDLTILYIFIGILFAEILLYMYITLKKQLDRFKNLSLVELIKVTMYMYLAFVLYENISSTTSPDIIDVIFNPLFMFGTLIIMFRLMESRHFKALIKPRRERNS